MRNDDLLVTPDMTILDVVSKYRSTDKIFKQYDEAAGVCICCEALFDPIKDVAVRFNLNLDRLMSELRDQVAQEPSRE